MTDETNARIRLRRCSNKRAVAVGIAQRSLSSQLRSASVARNNSPRIKRAYRRQTCQTLQVFRHPHDRTRISYRQRRSVSQGRCRNQARLTYAFIRLITKSKYHPVPSVGFPGTAAADNRDLCRLVRTFFSNITVDSPPVNSAELNSAAHRH